MLQRWEEGDEVVALWKTMNGWVYDGFDETYNAMGVSFDKLYYESDTYPLAKHGQGLADGVFFQKRTAPSGWTSPTTAWMKTPAPWRRHRGLHDPDIGTAYFALQNFPTWTARCTPSETNRNTTSRCCS